ncbi:endonuclease III [Candidatus Pacearchaeota archaeon]|nr:MAG: endonuclease III [Candidatus Pacearchaeota archaeon]
MESLSLSKMAAEKRKEFLKIFRLAEKKYGRSVKRLAGEGWPKAWQTLIVTIYSAQSRDEVTIPVMEKVFKELPTLEKFARAPLSKIEKLTRSINYYKTKSKNAKRAAQVLLEKFNGKVPDTLEELTQLPGVGRKTANLILSEIHKKPSITVDTHVHRISNVLGLVRTKTPKQTEQELMKIAPKRYWSRINRLFVLWGKDVPGRDKSKLLAKLRENS